MEVGVSSLHHGLRVLRRRWWVIGLATVAVGAVAYLLASRQAKMYSSTAAVLVAQPDLPTSSTANIQATLATHADLARVPQVAWQVLLHANAESMTIGGFLAHSSVATKPNSNVVDFTVSDTEPSLAERLATEYAAQFVAYRAHLAAKAIGAARKGVESQLRQLKATGQSGNVLYTALLNEDAQLRTIESLQSGSATVVQPGSAAVQTQPKPVQDSILGVGLGLGLGLGLAFMLEALDTRVRSADEIRERLGLPLLGRLPAPPRRWSHRSVASGEHHGPYAESIRTLRTTFSFATAEQHARVVAVTSAERQEGKSTTLANLAVSLASGGFAVIVVDLDLHRPQTARLFDVPLNHHGLTDVALGHATLDEALRHIPLPPRRSPTVVGRNGSGPARTAGRLDVLTSGPIPPDAGDFLGTEALHDILFALAERADIVLVDTPPLLMIGDALAISPSLDAALVVTRVGSLRRPALTEFRRKLDELPVEKLGFVLTAADVDENFSYRPPYTGRTLSRRPKRLKEPIA